MPVAFGNDRLFLAWQDPQEELYVVSSDDGEVFTNRHGLGEKSENSTRPAITYGNGKVYLAWIDPENRVNIISSPDGVYWSNKRTITETSKRKAPPAIAFLGDRLYLAWTGRDRDNHINITSFSVADDGELAEFGKLVLDEESSDDAGPALVATNEMLYLVWQGTDGHVNVIRSRNGKDFQNKETLREKIDHSTTPGIAYGDGVFYLAWVGKDEHLNLLTSSDGTNWGNKVTLPEKSSSTGTLGATYGNKTLFLDWSGSDSKRHLNVLSFKIENADGTVPEGKLTTLADRADR